MKILPKTDLDRFLAELGKQLDVFAPKGGGDAAEWTKAEAGSVSFDFANTRLSPKEFFLPQTECLMRFTTRRGDPEAGVMRPVPGLVKGRLLLNVRPCDAKAFALLDRIFVQDKVTHDPYWSDKRDKTVLAGLACAAPCPTCFCTSVGGGPAGESGLDLLLTDLGDRLLVKPLTERGQALVGDLADAPQADVEAGAAQHGAAEAAIAGNQGVETGALASAETMAVYELPLWEEVCRTCLNCGTCTFSCPTCHCFDIQDETKGCSGRRVRNWDTCMQALFTRHASGHNPRGEKKHRVRQRFMHKFKYIPDKRDGEIGCVGCGRCVKLCPAGIDVREVANRMNQETKDHD